MQHVTALLSASHRSGSKVFSRLFSSGTCAYLAAEARASSCVWWSDGSVVGDAATCSNAAIHEAACKKHSPTPVPAPTPLPPMPVPGQGTWVRLSSASLWSDTDCRVILPVLRNVTLEACQTACVTELSQGYGCTAINVNAQHSSAANGMSKEPIPDSCVLRKCKPGAKPSGGSKTGFVPWQYM